MSDARRPILVVDDDPDVLRLASRVLGSAGFRVLSAHDPREALETAVAERPCLLFVDLMMPHLDGEELLRAIRARVGDDAPRVVLVSAAYSRSEAARRMDADAVLAKPFAIDDLRDLAVRFAAEHRDRAGSNPPGTR